MFRKKFPFRPPSHVVTPLLRKALTVIISIDDSGKRVWPSRSCNPVLPRTLYVSTEVRPRILTSLKCDSAGDGCTKKKSKSIQFDREISSDRIVVEQNI